MNALAPIVSNCRDCIFAEYVGDTQDGCQFNRIEKFEANGAEIIGLDDGEKQYYTIVGRFCTASRTAEWAEGKPANQLKELARAEFTGNFTLVIYAPDGTSVDDLFVSIKSVIDQTPGPRSLKILFNKGNPNGAAYNILVRRLKLPFEYRFHQIEQPDTVQNSIYQGDGFRLAVDLGLADCTTTFYSVAKAGYAWHPDYLRRIDHALNDEMVRFVALLPDEDGNGLLVQTGLHNSKVGGNRIQPILEKILDIAKNEETTGHLVKNWNDLPPCENTTSASSYRQPE